MKKLWLIKGLVLLIALGLSFVTCTENYDQDTYHEDPELHRKDSLALTLINAVYPDSIKSTVNWLQGMNTRFAFASNHRSVAIKIRNRFIRMGYTDSFIDSFWVSMTWNNQNYAMWEYNVIAPLYGSSHPDSVIIVGAHYDDILNTGDPFSTVPGANDNASGVAAAIEIARVMKLKNFSPDISIEFVAFGAEELGLLGSADYAAKLALSGRPVKMMINNDMIAFEHNTNRSFWSVNIMNYDDTEPLWYEAKTLCSKYTGLNPLNDNTNNKKSDSYSFHTKSYKAIYFAANSTDPNYHTVNDLSINCNFNYCADVVRISCALLVYEN